MTDQTAPDTSCQLFLVAPPDIAPELCLTCVKAAAGALAVACLVLPAREDLLDKPLSAAQAMDIAVLVADDTRAAAYANADGAHISTGLEAIQAARKSLGSRSSIGGVSPCSRHIAMQLGEAGADYVAFDLSDRSGVDMIAWWAELFQVQCVGLNPPDLATAQSAIRAGADFIAPPSKFWSSTDDARAIASKLKETISP